MDLKANIDKDSFGYRNRLLLIALGALLYAAWCVYDAVEKYPDQVKAHQAITALKVEHEEDWRDRWVDVAAENGWDGTKEPIERTQGDITTQWIQFAIVFPIGAYCLLSVAVWSRRFLGADDKTLFATGGVEVPFDKVTRIDANRWENKGIARVYYDLGSGEKNVLIDDFKFERQATDAIFDRVKDAVGADKVHGLTQADAADEADAAEQPDPVEQIGGGSNTEQPERQTS